MAEMPPLPPAVGCIEYPGGEYEAAWVSSAEAYDEDQMHAYAQSYADGRVRELEKALRIGNDALVSAVRDMGAAQDRAEAAEKDAARYQFLRSQPEKIHERMIDVTRWLEDCSGESLRNEELDAAIDRAMEGTK